jgi:hypothetical protein
MALSSDRLPGWLRAANVRTGWIGSSAVAVFEDSPGDADTFRTRGEVGSDAVVLLDSANFLAAGAALKAGPSPHAIIMVGDPWHAAPGTNELGTRLRLSSAQPAFFDCGFAGYHWPRGLLEMFIELAPDPESDPIESRFIPFALYLREEDLKAIEPGIGSLCT